MRSAMLPAGRCKTEIKTQLLLSPYLMKTNFFLLQALNYLFNINREVMTMTSENQIRGSQIKAARALLRWTVRDLSTYSSISAGTICMCERGAILRPNTYASILNVLQRAGIRFIGDYGVTLEPQRATRTPIAIAEEIAA